VHVASVIYYLSIIKEKLKADPNFLKYPAKHLNEIFVYTEKLEEANNPKIVKHKRRHQILKEDNQNFQRYEEISSNSSDDAEDVISSKKRKKLLFHQCQRIILK
jgi:predicted P-loop ATPase/GTPase